VQDVVEDRIELFGRNWQSQALATVDSSRRPSTSGPKHHCIPAGACALASMNAAAPAGPSPSPDSAPVAHGGSSSIGLVRRRQLSCFLRCRKRSYARGRPAHQCDRGNRERGQHLTGLSIT
jgi:hypothetical protein